MSKWKIPYWISNNGDGSASIRIEKTIEDAEREDEKQNEDGEGWGESCCGTIDIVMVDGVPHYNHSEWDAKKKKWYDNLVPLVQD